jgi:hypothetical protein
VIKRRQNEQVKLVETPDPKRDGGWYAGPPPAYVVPDTTRRRAGTYGTLTAPAVELGNSTTVLPLTEDGKMPAYGLEGGGGVVAKGPAVMGGTRRRSARGS